MGESQILHSKLCQVQFWTYNVTLGPYTTNNDSALVAQV